MLPYISLIRRKKLVKGLTKAGAFSADSAKTLEEIGIENSGAEFSLLYDNIISATGNGRYYLNKEYAL
jgi:hypothetical protein